MGLFKRVTPERELHWRELPGPEWYGGKPRLWEGNRLRADLTGARDYGRTRFALLHGMSYRRLWVRLIVQPGDTLRVYAVAGRDIVGYLNQANYLHRDVIEAIRQASVDAGVLRLTYSEVNDSNPVADLRIGKHAPDEVLMPWQS